MFFYTDLHLHSYFSRATSKDLKLEINEKWAKKKGLKVIGTADFTHPGWFSELKEKLDIQDNGLYKIKNSKEDVFFLPSCEVSCIYSKGGKVRRIHLIILAPDLETVDKINTQFSWMGNLKSDGRPIFGSEAKEIVKIITDISEKAIVIPAHIWTPWFSLFGSESGFNSLQECFEEYSSKIYAIETGLSSDPPMNWRLSQLDNLRIVSFSDAHSPANLGREATVFELEKLTYDNIIKAIKSPDEKNKIAFTIEFFPEEGKYHWDGHRNCNLRLSPKDTKKYKGICPKCKKPLTVGVMNRVEQLADRPEGYKPKDRPPFKSLVPLEEIIAEALGQKKGTKAVKEEYENLIQQGGSEFKILLETSLEKLEKMTLPKVVEGIKRVREGRVYVLPGYDGVYGEVKVFKEEEKEEIGQKSLF